MQIIFQVNADDMNEDFLEGLRTTFKHKEIEIVAYELAETAYLLRSPANCSRLIEAVDDVDRIGTSPSQHKAVSMKIVAFHQPASSSRTIGLRSTGRYSGE